VSWQGSARKARLPEDWGPIRRDVLQRDGHRCRIRTEGCTGRATEVDHLVPGDDHSLGNLRAACTTCHGRKSSAEGVAARARLRALRARPLERHPGSRGAGTRR
jgi:5-methylcytosine-specific restriction protein A